MDRPGQGPDGTVVVPAIDAASSVACMRSLGRRGIDTIGISEQRRAPGFSSRYVGETIRVADPSADLSAYEDAILELAHRSDVRTVIPVREADVYVLARNYDRLDDLVATAWPTLERLRRVQDRSRLFDAARSADVATPETKPLDAWTEWDDDVIVKPRYTVHAPEYSTDFDERRVNERSTRYVPADATPDQAAIVEEMGHVPLVQEYVPTTDEYAFFALYDRGEPVATFQHRQERAWKYAGGPSAYRESIDVPELDAAGRRLLGELDWHGLAMVEFLRHPETGEFLLMEVNPRFWTSLPFTVQAGVDFPYLYWRQSTDRPITTEPSYEVGIGGHLLRGELLYLHSILSEEYPVVERPSFSRAVRNVLTSLAREPRFDYADLDDPLPFLRDSHNTVRQLFGERDPSRDEKRRQESDPPATLALRSIGETIRGTIDRF
ncbi:carboxylate--amine ligase [Halopiger goleimassiliensis]|uniref:carboxylate--amine ligase n=1 Tax=Halopiger goleimassiliensis TaxID=1293048 RepID=UPI00067778A1|nr:carboxylate--amine ligase [Halopiger goleimassiliensis]